MCTFRSHSERVSRCAALGAAAGSYLALSGPGIRQADERTPADWTGADSIGYALDRADGALSGRQASAIRHAGDGDDCSGKLLLGSATK